MLFTKYTNALNIPYASTRWNKFEDVGIIPNYTNLTGENDRNINLSCKNGIYQMPHPFLSRVAKFTPKESINNSDTSLIIQTNSFDSFDELKKFITENINPTKQMGLELGLSDKEDSIIDWIHDQKFVQPIIIIDGQLTQSCIERCRQLNLKYRNTINLWVKNIYSPAVVSQLVDIGVEGFILYNEYLMPMITIITNLFHCLYARKSNAKIILNSTQEYVNIKSFVAGIDLAIVDSEWVQYNIKNLRHNMSILGCKNTQELANNIQFIELN